MDLLRLKSSWIYKVIILYTKKLQDFLNIKGVGIPLPENMNQDAIWYGNIFIIKRKKVLQLTHEVTRFTIFIHGITKKDNPLNSLILQHLRHHMIKEQIPLFEMKYIDNMSNESFSYYKKINKQVLGTMRNMKLIYENYCLTNEIIDDHFITQKINTMLVTIHGKYVHPIDEFKEYMLTAALIHSHYY